MECYKRLATYTLIAVVSSGFLGCGQKNPEMDARKGKKPVYAKEIVDFGITRYDNKFKDLETAVAVGDMDGDGDLDVIISNGFGQVIVLENQIPQKRK